MSCCGGHETCNPFNLFEHTALTKSNQSQVLEIRRIHLILQAYLNAKADEVGLDKALANLEAIKVNSDYTFTPTPTQLYRSILADITLCYWTATLAILDTDHDHKHQNEQCGGEKEKLISILKIIPAGFGDSTPGFTGKEVENGVGLTLKQIESLMRVGGFIFKEITRNDVALMWSELGEVGGSLWEES